MGENEENEGFIVTTISCNSNPAMNPYKQTGNK